MTRTGGGDEERGVLTDGDGGRGAAAGPDDAGRPVDVPRLAAYAALAALPWTVVVYRGEFDLVFAWGLANTNPPNVVPLTDYLFVYTGGFRTLPAHLQAWPVGTGMLGAALASAAAGAVLGREDRRVTAGLLLLAAASHLRTTAGLARGDLTALPVGPALAVLVVWWFHAGDLRRLLPGRGD